MEFSQVNQISKSQTNKSYTKLNIFTSPSELKTPLMYTNPTVCSPEISARSSGFNVVITLLVSENNFLILSLFLSYSSKV